MLKISQVLNRAGLKISDREPHAELGSPGL